MGRKPRDLTDAPDVKLPKAAAAVAQAHPQLWEAYQRLVHLAYALGSASEGAAHSHVRRALAEGMAAEELEHVALLSMTTLGWPQAIRALALVQDIIGAGRRDIF